MAAVADYETVQVKQQASIMDQAATLIQAHYKRHQAQQQYKKQQQAARTIQAQTLCFLERRKVAQDHEQNKKAARFKAVMARHQERIQQLELEKRRIRDLPLDQLDAYQAKRQTAATVIQAHWRGSRQRQMLRNSCPGAVALRPVICISPTIMDRPSGGMRDQHQLVESKQSLEAATQTAASTGHDDCNSSSNAPKHLRGSCMTELPPEASILSVLSVAAIDGNDKSNRREAIPAARRMVLERQVQLRINAFKALHNGSSKLAALRAGKEFTDQRLAQLLQEHQAASSEHLKAARRRQKLLQGAEALHSQLQQLPQLSQVSEDARTFLAPAVLADAACEEKSRQAHALALAEARVGNRWWLPLDALNKQHMLQHIDAASDVDALPSMLEWKQMEASWKSNWDKIICAQQEQHAATACERVVTS